MLFELNHGYYPYMFFGNEVDPYLKSRSADKLAKILREFMLICQHNLLHTHKLQKQAYNKNVKLHSYAPDKSFSQL